MLVNGKELSIEELTSPSIQALLEYFSIPSKAVAIERNGEILPRKNWNLVVLQAEDQLELIRFVGGG